jgi:hypothetical protein
MYLLAVDPGISTGWALFYVSGPIKTWMAACGNGEPPLDQKDLVQFIVEKPQVYPGTPAGKANDLITLAWGAGGYYALAGKNPTMHERIMVRPHTWKGDVPKHVHQRRIWKTLNSQEHILADSCVRGMEDYIRKCEEVSARKRKSLPTTGHSDVMDAIGLGLYALNRLRP